MLQYDLIIIGGGASGLSAGVSALQHGIKKVLILERNNDLGGNLNLFIHGGFGKYYLGEEDGYISIFKTDADGNIIESEKKVYKDSKPITNLPETDQNYIKENKFSFESKDDALQKLSEMIS